MNGRQSFPSRGNSAFTLIELLVVVAIIGVLAAILLPIFGRTKQQADVVKTMSNMRQMGVAMLSYANDHNYLLPNRVKDGGSDAKWPTLLQPYLQDYGVYTSPIPDLNGVSYKVTDQNQFLNNGTNNTSYIYNGMNDIGAQGDTTVAIRINAISDATETVLLGIPNPKKGNFYMDFSDGDNNAILNKKAFSAGSIYMFCDGSSRMLAYNNDSTTYNTQRPPNAGTYTDWLWLVDKSASSVIK